MTIAHLFESFKRSWIHHTGLQLLTLTVLSGTFTMLACVFSVSISLGQIMTHWGDSIQMTVFLKEEIPKEKLSVIEKSLEDLQEFESVKFVSKQDARKDFSSQLASYAPDLLKDSEFDSAFPASFQLKLRDSRQADRLSDLAKKVEGYEGVEDVSYGQDWVENYSGFVDGISRFGKVMGVLLFLASLFIIGNSIRLSISQRVEEIEIQELVGSTTGMIRGPFLFEGAVLGALSSGIAVFTGYGIHQLEVKYLSTHLALLGIASQLNYLNVWSALAFIAVGASAGLIGSYVCLRHLNDGWSARRRVNS